MTIDLMFYAVKPEAVTSPTSFDKTIRYEEFHWMRGHDRLAGYIADKFQEKGGKLNGCWLPQGVYIQLFSEDIDDIEDQLEQGNLDEVDEFYGDEAWNKHINKTYRMLDRRMIRKARTRLERGCRIFFLYG